jgi:hypothetical protein
MYMTQKPIVIKSIKTNESLVDWQWGNYPYNVTYHSLRFFRSFFFLYERYER